jgi:hypothetical protein
MFVVVHHCKVTAELLHPRVLLGESTSLGVEPLEGGVVFVEDRPNAHGAQRRTDA